MRDDREGFVSRPQPPSSWPTQPLDSDRDVIDLAEAVRADQANRPDGLPIGGSLRRIVLTNKGRVSMDEFHRFDDDAAAGAGKHS